MSYEKIKGAIGTGLFLGVISLACYQGLQYADETAAEKQLREEVKIVKHDSGSIDYTILRESDSQPTFESVTMIDGAKLFFTVKDEGENCGIDEVIVYRNDQEVGRYGNIDECEEIVSHKLDLLQNGLKTYHAVVTDSSNQQAESRKTTIDFKL
tara:strand:- start:61069 stop:61530 length:462 start_codon:yes stop_codon:yes gene_type:complete